jgi:hypothetical protein
MAFKPVRDGHGKVVGVEFKPTLKMLRVAVEFNREENANITNLEILKKCGVSEQEWNRWRNEYVVHEYEADRTTIKSSFNHFEDWFDNAIHVRSKEERELLRLVGMQKALSGDYNFWKDMSRTYGTIHSEMAAPTQAKIPFQLGQDNASIEDLREARDKLLAAHRGVGNQGGTGMARLTTKRSKG